MTINHINNEQNGEFVAFEGKEKLGYISYERVRALAKYCLMPLPIMPVRTTRR